MNHMMMLSDLTHQVESQQPYRYIMSHASCVNGRETFRCFTSDPQLDDAKLSTAEGYNTQLEQKKAAFHLVHPFHIDAHRAARLTKRYGCNASLQALLIQLCAFDQAVAEVDTFEQGTHVVSKVCCEEVPSSMVMLLAESGVV